MKNVYICVSRALVDFTTLYVLVNCLAILDNKNMDRKAVIKNADMSEDMQVNSILVNVWIINSK